MELVLLRHAKAEDCSPGLADEERNLTPKGRKRARSVAKGLSRYLEGTNTIQVWYSPALRSRETAAILAEVLGKVTMKEFQSIYSGYLEQLVEEWQQAAENEAIVIVGHEPYLSLWTQQLAGASLPFKKCTAVGIALQSPTVGTIQWFANPKTLVKIGKY